MIFSKVQLIWVIVFLGAVISLMSIAMYHSSTQPSNVQVRIADCADFKSRVEELERLAH